jgi:hemolysin activation/secretion protein
VLDITKKIMVGRTVKSVATLEASAIKDGIVPIRVIEGSIEEIQLDPPTKRINSRYVRSRLNLGISKPFSTLLIFVDNRNCMNLLTVNP